MNIFTFSFHERLLFKDIASRMPTFFQLLFIFLLQGYSLFSTTPPVANLSSSDTHQNVQKILKIHPAYQEWNRELVMRVLETFFHEIDPMKICFMKAEFEEALFPIEKKVEQIVSDVIKGDFSFFEMLFRGIPQKIERQHALRKRKEQQQQHKEESRYKEHTFQKKIDSEYALCDGWVKDEEELLEKLLLIDSLQEKAIEHFSDPVQKKQALYTIQKSKDRYEKLMTPDASSTLFNRTFNTLFLKAFCQSLDSESAFLTPREVQQFMIQVEQRLSGIGVLLRDDCDGLAIVKIMEGGPSCKSRRIQIGDKIIAVDRKPVIGMNVEDVIELIRGAAGTRVIVTLTSENGSSAQEIDLIREEVLLNEDHVEVTIREKKGGKFLILKLSSFYENNQTSSYEDLFYHLEKAQKKDAIRGVILDIRNNPGGVLTQAVKICSLFLNKGIIVSIKDASKSIHHFRNLHSKPIWNGPLIILVNRVSASASEIVAQGLQDWGRALVVGDDRTFGKGSFQTMAKALSQQDGLGDQGEFKITLGRYYTVSGKSPQVTGVLSDIEVPGSYRFRKIGERFLPFPLSEDTISSHFIDQFDDLPFYQRPFGRSIYKHGAQSRQFFPSEYIQICRSRSFDRIIKNKKYQQSIALLESLGDDLSSIPSKWSLCKSSENFNEPQEDILSHRSLDEYQLEEACNILEDIIMQYKER